ncbi:MAG: hypothetical protein C4336_06840 [Armatimonadota bacterium]
MTVWYNREGAGRLYRGLQQVYRAAQELKLSNDVLQELNAFRKQPEIDAIIERYKAESGD